MKLVKKLSLVIGIIIVVIIVCFNWQRLQIKWVEIFKQDKVFLNYNTQGNLEGGVIQYKAGKLYVTGNLVNGVKQGWETMFYKNGELKSKTYFVNGLPAGKGYLYNNEGKLAYSGSYKYGKRYGGWYEYYSNGHIKKYVSYDIDKLNNEISFAIDFGIDGELKLKDMRGLVVSPNFYSFDLKNHTLIPLNYKKNPGRKFNNINDLYITVANPIHTRLSVTIKINKSQYKFDTIKSNTIKISNAFMKKERYDIFVESHLYDKYNKAINGINIKDSLVKE